MYLPEVPVYPGRMSWRCRSNVRTNLPLEEVAHEHPQHGEFLSTSEAEMIFTNGVNERYMTGVKWSDYTYVYNTGGIQHEFIHTTRCRLEGGSAARVEHQHESTQVPGR